MTYNTRHIDTLLTIHCESELAATLRTWFTAGGAIRIALRQLLKNQKLRQL